MSDRLSRSQPFWEVVEERRRSRMGRPPKFKTAADLAQACHEYFTWVEENPLWEAKLVSYMGDSEIVKVPKMRAMTLKGLYAFLGIEEVTWFEWRNRQKAIHLAKVVPYVEKIIYEQKFSGAAAGILNAMVITRDLGLKEQTETDNRLQNPDGSPIQFPGTITLKGKRADDGSDSTQ